MDLRHAGPASGQSAVSRPCRARARWPMPPPPSPPCTRWACRDRCMHAAGRRARCARCAHRAGSRSFRVRSNGYWTSRTTNRPRACWRKILRARPCEGRTMFVTGILGDKDVDGVARALAGSADAWILCGIDAPRGLSAARAAFTFASLQRRKAGRDGAGRDAHGCTRGLFRRPHRGVRFFPCRGSGAAGTRALLIVYTGAVTSSVKERLTGALILIVVVVIVVPEMFSGRARTEAFD